MVTDEQKGSRLKLRCLAAYACGERAKHGGLFRESPFYESPVEDRFFFGGYDGVSFNAVADALSAEYAQA